jgi:hypothetical protein
VKQDLNIANHRNTFAKVTKAFHKVQHQDALQAMLTKIYMDAMEQG